MTPVPGIPGEDYNKIAVKKAKEIPAPGDAAGDGPSEAASVIGLVWPGAVVGMLW
jgi:hypothetical protein